MRLIADVMGADASAEVLAPAFAEGARLAGVDLTLCGDEAAIRGSLSAEALSRVRIEHAPTALTMDDSAMSVLKSKKDSSMARALCLLRDAEGDAVISAGNTGALLTGASVLVGRFDGLKCAAIGAVLPFTTPTLLMDAGASLTVLPENFLQFGHLGATYMETLFGVSSARVGLVNNGVEEGKGTPVYREAHALLSQANDIRFVGNIEGRDIPFGKCDVLLCDGFVGNILLKLSEGFGFYLSGTLKQLFYKSFRTRLAALFVKNEARAIKHKLDYTEYGGAPILGIRKPVVKAHGSSTPKAIASAVRMAARYAECGYFERVTERLQATKSEASV